MTALDVGNVMQDSKAYRLIKRQINQYSEILRQFAAHKYLETKRALWESKDIYKDIANNFLDKICLNAWNLFGDNKQSNKKSHYLRLLDTNPSLKKSVIEIMNRILPNRFYSDQDYLKAVLLHIAGLSNEDFDRVQKNLKGYRNKFVAHADDYSPTKASDEIYFFPYLEPLAKLAYASNSTNPDLKILGERAIQCRFLQSLLKVLKEKLRLIRK